MLQEFDRVVPGAARTILNDAHEQTQHRITMERLVLTAKCHQAKAGQWMAYTLGVLGLGCGFYLALNGREISGAVFVIADLFALARVFISGQQAEQKSLAERQSDAPHPRSVEG